MEPAFLNLTRGNRIVSFMGLVVDPGRTTKYGKDYKYVEIPVRELWNPTTESIVDRANRNQHLKIVPACTLDVKGYYTVMVVTNPKLQEVSSCPSTFIIDPNEGAQPAFWAQFHKSFDLKDLDWAVRLYMFA